MCVDQLTTNPLINLSTNSQNVDTWKLIYLYYQTTDSIKRFSYSFLNDMTFFLAYNTEVWQICMNNMFKLSLISIKSVYKYFNSEALDNPAYHFNWILPTL